MLFFFSIYITSALSYRYSVPFFRLPFLRNIHVDLYSKSTIYCLKYTDAVVFFPHISDFQKCICCFFFPIYVYLCSFLQLNFIFLLIFICTPCYLVLKHIPNTQYSRFHVLFFASYILSVPSVKYKFLFVSLIFEIFVHMPELFPCPFEEWSRVSYKKDFLCINYFDKISTTNFVSGSFIVLLRYAFCYFFLHFYLFDRVRFHYSQVPVIFLLSKSPVFFFFFLIWHFYPFIFFSFSPLDYQHGTCFNVKFHSYILTVYYYYYYYFLLLLLTITFAKFVVSLLQKQSVSPELSFILFVLVHVKIVIAHKELPSLSKCQYVSYSLKSRP